MLHWIGAQLLALIVATPVSLPSAAAVAGRPFRAFSGDSYWNTPLPVEAPRRADSAEIIDFIRGHSSTDFIYLSGTDSTGAWGQPVYWAGAGDPEYDVVKTRYYIPPEFANLRIPVGAKPDPSSDAEMTIYDLERGYVAGLWAAEFDPATNIWSAGGGEVFYLNSNGLDARLPQSDDPRNTGAHRGLPPPSYAIRHDEVLHGRIDHVMKIATPAHSNGHVYPMVDGEDNGYTHPHAPPEGTRIRIKPEIDLTALGLTAPALTVATALQRYGFVIGDTSGGPNELKVENTIAEGRGHLWDGVLAADSLAGIPLSDYEVIEFGFSPPPDAPKTRDSGYVPPARHPIILVALGAASAALAAQLGTLPAQRRRSRRRRGGPAER